MITVELTLTVRDEQARTNKEVAQKLEAQASLIRKVAIKEGVFNGSSLIDSASILDGLASAARNGGKA